MAVILQFAPRQVKRKTCWNCKHWFSCTFTVNDGIPLGLCGSPKRGKYFVEGPRREPKIHTEADFGCNQWEGK